MLIRKSAELSYADITPQSVYLDRRKFLRAMGIVGATAVAGKGLFDLAWPSQTAFAATKLTGLAKSPFSTTEKQNTYEDVTHYNNFYEFGTDKSDPAKNSQKFQTTPWTVSVEGEVKKPRKFSMDEILKIVPLEERIYRHRCVEAWSIVVPWIGFSFSNLVNLVEPTPKAKFVAFESYFDPRQMPQAKYAGPAHGRSDESARSPLRRHVRRNASASGRRARTLHSPVEIWLQEREVAGQNQVPGKNAADHLESPRVE
jgi:methionine sulfoxide reductase catalytic subunit